MSEVTTNINANFSSISSERVSSVLRILESFGRSEVGKEDLYIDTPMMNHRLFVLLEAAAINVKKKYYCQLYMAIPHPL